ncbi:MAG: ABC transporter permease [Desulfomicrobium escambiense]|nr:ABC transporter permease [Desulfomicrobium escambiense]
MRAAAFRDIAGMALRNLGRHRVKTVITTAAVAISAALYIFMDGWILGMNLESRRNIVAYEMGAAKLQSRAYFEKKDELPMYEGFKEWEPLAAALAEAGYDSAPRFVFTGTLYSRAGTAPVLFNAVDPRYEARLLRYPGYLEAGRFPRSGGSRAGRGIPGGGKTPCRHPVPADPFGVPGGDPGRRGLGGGPGLRPEPVRPRAGRRGGKGTLLRPGQGRPGRGGGEACPQGGSEPGGTGPAVGHPGSLGPHGRPHLHGHRPQGSLGFHPAREPADRRRGGRGRQLAESENQRECRLHPPGRPPGRGGADAGGVRDGAPDPEGRGRRRPAPGTDEAPEAVRAALDTEPGRPGNGPARRVWKSGAGGTTRQDYLAAAAGDNVSTRIMILFLFILSFIGISNTMLMAILERTKEIGDAPGPGHDATARSCWSTSWRPG